MKHTFYVTTQEIDHPEREHNFRFAQGELPPEDHKIKAQRPAGNFRFGQFLKDEDLFKLTLIK